MPENNKKQKEELLKKLTEIYDQIEDLEKTLDTNLSEHRKNLMKEQTSSLKKCEKQIAKLEARYDKDFSLNREKSIFHNREISLKLGF